MLVSIGAFGEIGAVVEWLLLLSPVQSCQVLIHSAFMPVASAQLVVSFGYTLVASACLYWFVVRKRFKKYAMGD